MTWLRVERAVAAGVEQALSHFWSIESLKQGWSAITSFTVLFQDRSHQEARMSVVRDGSVEEIRVLRFLCGTNIEFFTPQPPPMMSWHRGAWRFRPIGGGCLITAEREYDLCRKRGETELELLEREHTFQEAFEARLGRILASFCPGGEPCASSI